MIYKHKASITASSGSTSTTTLDIRGGLCRQLIIRANTSSTVFKAYVQDDNDIVLLNYPYHTGEINDWTLSLPMSGRHLIAITNASPDDTFTVLAQVEEI